MSKAGWRTLSLTLFGWWTSFTLGKPEEEKVNWSVREVMERELEGLKEMDEEELMLTLDFLNSKRSSVLLVHILVTTFTFLQKISSQSDSDLFWNYLYCELNFYWRETGHKNTNNIQKETKLSEKGLWWYNVSRLLCAVGVRVNKRLIVRLLQTNKTFINNNTWSWPEYVLLGGALWMEMVTRDDKA